MMGFREFLVEMPYKRYTIPKIVDRDESDMNTHLRNTYGFNKNQKLISKHNGHHVYMITPLVL